VRQGDFKLIEFYEDNHVELYDLKHDLGETRDLARQQAALARRMQQRLAAWRGAVNAQMMTPNPAYQGAGRSGGNDHASTSRQRRIRLGVAARVPIAVPRE
jgi:hypothetical protein